MMSLPFQDRHDAGRQLAYRLHCYAGGDTVVTAVLRGGAPVAYEIAHALRAPLEIFLLRHLTEPDNGRRSFGVVGSGGVRVVDAVAVAQLGISVATIEEATQRERLALLARERTYRGPQAMLDLAGRLVILVDDGLTPEAELKECIAAVRAHDPRVLVLAIPVVDAATCTRLHLAVDDLVFIVRSEEPMPLQRWYRELTPVSHTEVRALLSLVDAEAQSRELARA
jgi:putative phosphoribosyl transferase